MNNKKNKISFETVILIFLFLSSLGGGLFFGYITAQVKNFSGITNLKKFQPAVPTKIFDVNGELIAELFQEKRNLVSYDDLPKTLINAFLATEDQEFYEHFGINPIAIMRAMVKNIKAGRIVQGGSTITQQLAKRIFTKGQKTYARKMLEAILAFQIEKKFSKQEILEMYFNQIYLGHGCYGVASAAKLFFNKDVENLTLAESSVLAALPSAPTKYSPFKNFEEAYLKNQDILERMIEEGYLTRQKAVRIKNQFWPSFFNKIKTEYTTKTAHTRIVDKAPHFTNYIRRILISRFGKDVVYNHGLNVYTTLNLKRQKIAEKYLQEGVKKQDEVSAKVNKYYSSAFDRSLFNTYSLLRTVFSLASPLVKRDIQTYFRKNMIEKVLDSADVLMLFGDARASHAALEQFRGSTALNVSSSLKVEGAFLAIEPTTGYITSMVGGSEFSVDNQLNRAVQARRQPGSSFKPFVYGAGIESRIINPGTAIPDAPMVNINESGETWTPGNYEGEFSGLVRVRRALAASINIISIRIYDMVGAERITRYASRLLKVPASRFNENPSMALGTNEMTPFEMANGYAIYANRGRDVIPFAIRYVLDRDGYEVENVEQEVGKIIAIKEKEGKIQIISEDVAYVMTDLMRTVVDRGTAASVIRRDVGFRNEAAGKTGTTTNWTDAWFCGFTPDLAAVVWIGYDRPFMSLGPHQSGAGVAAPIWANYMKDVYKGMKSSKFPAQPRGVYKTGLCAFSGKYPSEKCDKLVTEIMIRGSGAVGVCDGKHFKMQSVDERYLQKEGLVQEEE